MINGAQQAHVDDNQGDRGSHRSRTSLMTWHRRSAKNRAAGKLFLSGFTVTKNVNLLMSSVLSIDSE